MSIQRIYFIQRPAAIELPAVKVSKLVHKSGSLVWLQKMCAWILIKLTKGTDPCGSIKVEVVDVDLTNLVNVIYKQMQTLGGRYNTDARHILIGAEEFAELCHSPVAAQMMTIKVRDTYFNGLKITIVPWMKGILVMPEF